MASQINRYVVALATGVLLVGMMAAIPARAQESLQPENVNDCTFLKDPIKVRQCVRYRGDSIRILTQNQWLRYTYECAFDPVARKIVSVELRPGRLVPPAAVAQAAGAVVGQPAPQKPVQPKAAQAQPVAATPKLRRHFGEPSPVSITQAHLHKGQVDTTTRIYQIPLGGS